MKLSEKIRACDFRAPAEVPDYEYGATKDYSSIKFYSIDTNEVLHLASQVAELEADLKKLRTDFCAVVSEREQLKQEFSVGVAQAVGWMTAEFECLHEVNCPELLEKVLASLGEPK